MPLTSGFQVNAPQAATLQQITLPTVQGVDPSVFKNNNAAALVHGIASGSEAGKVLADSLDPLAWAQRKAGIAKSEAEAQLIPMQTEMTKAQLGFQRRAIEDAYNADKVANISDEELMKTDDSKKAPEPTDLTTPVASGGAPIIEMAQPENPSDTGITAKISNGSGTGASVNSSPSSVSAPLDTSAKAVPEAKASEQPKDEFLSQNLTTQQRSNLLKKQQAELLSAHYKAQFFGDPTSKNRIDVEKQIEEELGKRGAPYAMMTNAERQAFLQKISPEAAKIREASQAQFHKFNDEKSVKDYKDIVKGFNGMMTTVESAGKARSGADDLALINNFVQTIVPGQAVRPIEIETIESAAPYFAKAGLKFGRLFPDSNGNLLTSDQVAQMVKAARYQVQGAFPLYENERQNAMKLAQSTNVPSNIFPEAPKPKEPLNSVVAGTVAKQGDHHYKFDGKSWNAID